jgi:uncharacterized protein (TIGR02300 family)
MAKAELGTKRIDPETGQKFYDLGKDPMTSPYTGVEYARSFFEAPPRAKRGYGAPKPVHREEEAEVEAVVEEEEAEVVSLSDVDEEEGTTAKDDKIDIDDDEEPETAEDDTFLAIDEDEDDDVTDIVGSREDDD